MRESLTTHILDPSEYDAWREMVDASPHGSIYADPAYLGALSEAVGGSFRILAAKRSDEILGGVPLFENPAGPPGWLSPRMLLYYNGLVVRESEAKYPSKRTGRVLEVTAALEEGLSGAGYERIILKSRSTFTDVRAFLVKGWTAGHGYTYVVRIDDLDRAWDLVEQNLRRLVRRCADKGLTLTDDDDFDSYWRMHVATTERKDLNRYLPEEAFRRFFATLHEQGLCRLYHARLPDGRSVAAQMVLLGRHEVTHTVSAATDAEYLSMGATAFLRWKVFEALASMGYRANDLTDAALNPVTHFKSQLGGDLELCIVLSRSRTDPPGLRRRVRKALGVLLGG